MITGKYPGLRLRRSRKNDWSRRLIEENNVINFLQAGDDCLNNPPKKEMIYPNKSLLKTIRLIKQVPIFTLNLRVALFVYVL